MKDLELTIYFKDRTTQKLTARDDVGRTLQVNSLARPNLKQELLENPDFDRLEASDSQVMDKTGFWSQHIQE